MRRSYRFLLQHQRSPSMSSSFEKIVGGALKLKGGESLIGESFEGPSLSRCSFLNCTSVWSSALL